MHGDEVLIAQPSYPLFDFLADLDDVQLVPYPLFYDYGWHLDPEALRSQITSRTRAIVVVHPNNPTGHFTKLGEREVLEQLCTEHGLALIVDEVFLDYPIEDAVRAPSFATGEHPVLTFVLSGLSKIAGLPQMKAAWVSCFGPEPALRQGYGAAGGHWRYLSFDQRGGAVRNSEVAGWSRKAARADSEPRSSQLEEHGSASGGREA